MKKKSDNLTSLEPRNVSAFEQGCPPAVSPVERVIQVDLKSEKARQPG